MFTTRRASFVVAKRQFKKDLAILDFSKSIEKYPSNLHLV